MQAKATHAVVHRQRALGQQQLRLLAGDVRVRLLLQRQRRKLLQPPRRGDCTRGNLCTARVKQRFWVSAFAVRTATLEGLKPREDLPALHGSATLGTSSS